MSTERERGELGWGEGLSGMHGEAEGAQLPWEHEVLDAALQGGHPASAPQGQVKMATQAPATA